MTPADLIKPEDAKVLSNLWQLIQEFKPVLQAMLQAGFPFEDHWNTLLERETWARRMAEVFQVDLNTTLRQ